MASPELQMQNPEPDTRVTDNIVRIASVLLITALSIATALLLYISLPRDTLVELGKTHARFLLGIPAAAIMSFIVIGLMRAVSGPIEFEALGFKFRGASGPVVLWIFTYLACVSGALALW